MIPEDLRYTSEHEWVRSPGEQPDSVRVGITDYAQDALGDIVYVQLPEVGTAVAAGDAVGELESTKSVSDIYAPVSGEIIANNADAAGAPESVNAGAYEAWLFKIKPTNADDVNALMSAADYEAKIG